MKIVLRNHQSPGDVMMLTACVRDLKRWYPDWEIDVDTSCPDLWLHNPYITKLKYGADIVLQCEYPLIHESNQNKDVHFLHGFIKFVNEKLNIHIKLIEFRGDIHLTEEEKSTRLPGEPDKPFWIVVAGGKNDYPHKVMWLDAWQKIVDCLKDKDIILVLSGGKDGGHFHHSLKGPHIVDMVGQTNIRQLLCLISRCTGVLSHVTLHMHAAMALGRYAVTVAGGLEPANWEGYPCDRHAYIHTIGSLDCCKDGACWKLRDCNGLIDGKQKCFTQIEPEYVAEQVIKFHNKLNENKTT